MLHAVNNGILEGFSATHDPCMNTPLIVLFLTLRTILCTLGGVTVAGMINLMLGYELTNTVAIAMLIVSAVVSLLIAFVEVD